MGNRERGCTCPWGLYGVPRAVWGAQGALSGSVRAQGAGSRSRTGWCAQGARGALYVPRGCPDTALGECLGGAPTAHRGASVGVWV